LEGAKTYCQTGENGRNSYTTYVPEITMDIIIIVVVKYDQGFCGIAQRKETAQKTES
jgi:hypothetical protein